MQKLIIIIYGKYMRCIACAISMTLIQPSPHYTQLIPRKAAGCNTYHHLESNDLFQSDFTYAHIHSFHHSWSVWQKIFEKLEADSNQIYMNFKVLYPSMILTLFVPAKKEEQFEKYELLNPRGPLY